MTTLPTPTPSSSKKKALAAQARRKRLMWMVAASMLVAVVAVTAIVIVITQRDSESSSDNLPSPMSLDAIPSNGMILGDPDAPITVVEYADYQCPYCARFALQTEPQLIQDFVATGKIRYEFRPMPILSRLPLEDPGNESVRAAEASMCALDQDRFWDYHHVLFTKQTGENIGTFSDANLIAYATETGLDVPTFSTCLASGTHKQAVLDSRQGGIDAGVAGTPTFLIDGTRVTLTTQGYDRLKEQIQSALEGK